MTWTANQIRELGNLIKKHAWQEDARGYTHSPQVKENLAQHFIDTANAIEDEEKKGKEK